MFHVMSQILQDTGTELLQPIRQDRPEEIRMNWVNILD